MLANYQLLTAYERLASGADRFLQDESGPTATEYGIMLAVLLIVVIGAIGAMGQAHKHVWEDVGTALDPVVNMSSGS